MGKAYYVNIHMSISKRVKSISIYLLFTTLPLKKYYIDLIINVK